jgi:beta-phosphoglucomutase family hydrolase
MSEPIIFCEQGGQETARSPARNTPEPSPQSTLRTPSAPHIRGLVFDFDGTVVDSMPLHWQAWQSIIRRHGFQFNERRFYALGGVPSCEIIATLNREQGLSLDVLAVAREKELAYLALLENVRTIEPIVDIIRNRHGLIPMAVASGGTRRVIHKALEQLHLSRFFDAVVTSEDVTRQKPAPDIYLEAARLIGVPPEQCRAYEDTDLGLQAIQAAGMDAVDVRDLLGNPYVA